jgi:hypothetical protein
MSLPKQSDLFEQLIQRIHELLERDGAEVTWNEHIPDPDNPRQPRQVDVTVRRDGTLTLIECRIRKKPQDVMWIEELMGRRDSLGATAVVAVSASGFTDGARLKAAAKGVALRELAQLSDDDIRAWGRSVSMALFCYQYSDLVLTLGLEGEVPPDRDAVDVAMQGHPLLMGVFNQAADYLTSEGMITSERLGKKTGFRIDFVPGTPVFLADRQIMTAELKGSVVPTVLDVQCPIVEAYGNPLERTDAQIERFQLGETSIVHDGDRVAIHVDVSKLDLPPLCHFRFIRTIASREVDVDVFSIVGIDKLTVTSGPIDLHLFRSA